jgi:hypothetical protein
MPILGVSAHGAEALTGEWGCPMNTELQLVILSIVALHIAALVGGGLALGIMRLFGRKPPRLGTEDAGDSVG